MSNPTKTDYVVGDDDCTFTKIVRLVMDTNVSLTYSHLFMLMVYLETKDSTKTEIESRSRQHIPSYECLDKMLVEWRSRMSSRALLSTFIEYLRNCYLNTLADVLQNEFWPGSLPTEFKPSEKHHLLTVDNASQPQAPYFPQEGKNTENCFLLSYTLRVFVAAVSFLIPVTIIVANNMSQNGSDDSSLSQLVPNDSKSNETMTHQEIDYFNKFGAELVESIILPENEDIVVTESTQFRSRNTKELVVKSSEKLNEFFLNKIHPDNLVKLEFNNSLGQICKRDDNEVSSETVNLVELQELVLDVSQDCDSLVDRILNYIDMNYLKILKFRGSITNGFIQQVQEFLHRYYRTLKEIHILGALENTINIFEIRNTVVLNSVKVVSVKLDHVWDTTVHRKMVNDRFCSIFPRLARFETRNILISFNELLKLQNCSSLENINTTVRINVDDVKLFKQLNWQETFQSLKYVAVYFRFDVCPDYTFFEELIRKFDMFEKYKLCSNCNLSSTRGTIHCMHKSNPTQFIYKIPRRLIIYKIA